MSTQTIFFSQFYQRLIVPSKIDKFSLLIMNNVSSQINASSNKFYHSRELGQRNKFFKTHF